MNYHFGANARLTISICIVAILVLFILVAVFHADIVDTATGPPIALAAYLSTIAFTLLNRITHRSSRTPRGPPF
jgi:hypothetical protein